MRIGQTSAIHFGSRLLMTALGFGANIYFANVLGAEVLGKYFLVVAALLWLTIPSTIGIPEALKKRLSEGEEQNRYFTAALLAQLAIFAVVGPTVYFARGAVNEYVGAPVSEFVLLLLFLSLFYQLVRAALAGEHKVHISSLLQPTTGILRALTQLGLVAAGWKLLGMLTGYAVAAALTTLVGAVFLSSRLARPQKRHFEQLYDYSRYAWMGNVRAHTVSSIDTIVLGLFVLPTFVGIYEIAWNIATFFAIFGVSVTEALFPKISEKSSSAGPNAIGENVNQALAFAGLFVAPGLVGAVLLGDGVLRIFGAEFSQGYWILVVLTLSQLFFAYQLQLTNVLNAVDRPDLAFRVNAVLVVSNVVLNVGLVSLFGWFGAATATTISILVGLVLAFHYLSSIVQFTTPVWTISAQWGATGVMGAVVWVGRMIMDSSLFTTVVLVGVGVVVYGVALLGLSTRVRNAVTKNLPFRLPLFGG